MLPARSRKLDTMAAHRRPQPTETRFFEAEASGSLIWAAPYDAGSRRSSTSQEGAEVHTHNTLCGVKVCTFDILEATVWMDAAGVNLRGLVGRCGPN
jgi:hypothetical protein